MLLENEIAVDKSFFDVLKEPSSESFTWASTESYAQIETISKLAHSVLTLQYEDMSDLWFSNSFAWSTKSRIEEYQATYNSLKSSIEWSGMFVLPTVDEIEDMLFESVETENKEFKMSAIQGCAICSI